MRLSAQEYSATADALQSEAQLGASPAEQERLMATARLASRLAEQMRERGRSYRRQDKPLGSES